MTFYKSRTLGHTLSDSVDNETFDFSVMVDFSSFYLLHRSFSTNLQLSVIYAAKFGQSWISDAKPNFGQDKLDQYGDLTYNQFKKKYADLDVGLGQTFEEEYRVYKRECYLYGKCKFDPTKRASIRAKPVNNFDLNNICPDSVVGEAWDYADMAEVEINNRVLVLKSFILAVKLC